MEFRRNECYVVIFDFLKNYIYFTTLTQLYLRTVKAMRL